MEPVPIGLIVHFHVFSNFMRQQAMSERMVFNRPIPVNRLVGSIADSTYSLVLMFYYFLHDTYWKRHK